MVDDVPVERVADVAEAFLCSKEIFFTRIANLALDGGSLDELLACAHGTLGNPIVVYDRALRARSSASNNESFFGNKGSSAYRDPDLLAVSPEAKGFLELVAELEEKGSVFRRRMSDGSFVSACKTRSINDDYLLVCVTETNRNVTQGDMQTLHFICSLIEMSIKVNGGSSREELGFTGLLVDAFEGRLSGFDEFQSRMNAFGYRLRSRTMVIVLVPQKGYMNDRQANRIMGEMMGLFPYGYDIRRGRMIVFFANYDKPKAPSAADFRQFEAFLKGRNLLAAVGEERAVEEPMDELYRSAIFALEVGRKAFPERCLVFFDECRPYWPLVMCAQSSDMPLYVHPALHALRDYDSRNGSSLGNVLRCYVMNRGNRTKTARDLFVQRNTLQSRIREIELICRVDLSDRTTIDHIRKSSILEQWGVLGK